MSDKLRESVSALMDGEADELELRRLLASDDFARVRVAWSDLQLTRSAMHGINPALAGLDISARVQSALADESRPAARESWRWWKPVTSVAVAASMAAVVVMGVRNFNTAGVGAAPAAATGIAAATGSAPVRVADAAVSPNAGKVFPVMPTPLRGSSTVSASYNVTPYGSAVPAYGSMPGSIVVPVQMYGTAQSRAAAEAQLRRRLQTYLLMQVEHDQPAQAANR